MAFFISASYSVRQLPTFSNFEVVVIDDGSTDKTKELVTEFLIETRFHYEYKNNEGASSARNLGLKLSPGDMITYVDSDEEIYPNYLQVILKFLHKSFFQASKTIQL